MRWLLKTYWRLDFTLHKAHVAWQDSKLLARIAEKGS